MRFNGSFCPTSGAMISYIHCLAATDNGFAWGLSHAFCEEKSSTPPSTERSRKTPFCVLASGRASGERVNAHAIGAPEVRPATHRKRGHEQQGAQGALPAGKPAERGTKRKSVVIGAVGAYRSGVHGPLKLPASDVECSGIRLGKVRRRRGPRNPCFGRTMSERKA